MLSSQRITDPIKIPFRPSPIRFYCVVHFTEREPSTFAESGFGELKRAKLFCRRRSRRKNNKKAGGTKKAQESLRGGDKESVRFILKMHRFLARIRNREANAKRQDAVT
ncbi:hypothetical protein GWI33_021076 [Rhynchophorus ferrugineus]|uniref:Uncharacterized protein n=1 Tax=Rhynchophorus ferrugineus TaxID=354439 RepID=A0A834HNE7_RHYFE|nr:hypothetical protein GWI33_021076 [Rhynchophorus ferrugineus]